MHVTDQGSSPPALVVKDLRFAAAAALRSAQCTTRSARPREQIDASPAACCAQHPTLQEAAWMQHQPHKRFKHFEISTV
eukprot:18004-Heterococcus_DN1.PRE.2